jgi:OOP family OmpA-OmpF porin
MRPLVLAALGSFFCIGAAAYGQSPGDRHFYLGAALGQSKLDRTHVIDNPVLSSDDEAGIYSVHAGYRFNRYLALEGGYSDLGSYELELQGLCLTSLPPICGGTVSARTEVEGFFVNAVGTWPVAAHFQFSASAGAIHREVTFSTMTGETMYSADGTVWKFGIGIAVPINDRLEVGLDVIRYLDLGLDLVTPIPGEPYTVDSGDATAVTVGVRWLF